MNINKIKCDGCGLEQQIEPAQYGGSIYWITVQKGQSSTDILPAGTHHFCSESCLHNFFNTASERKRTQTIFADTIDKDIQ